MFPSDVLRAICWQESRWKHFLPNGKPKSNLNSNGSKDWGLMQINQATYEQQWNWKANVARAIALLADKRRLAENYLGQHPQGVTPDMVENEMIQRYNGGRYYRWDANMGTWQARPPNNYVAFIRGFMNSKPW
jgi:Transglycosylase SLT domain